MKKKQALELVVPQVEMLADTRALVEAYATQQGMTFMEAAILLTFNEIRCVHSHIDADMEGRSVKYGNKN
jgi:hypothetical protein